MTKLAERMIVESKKHWGNNYIISKEMDSVAKLLKGIYKWLPKWISRKR
jgi:hypothetical protein